MFTIPFKTSKFDLRKYSIKRLKFTINRETILIQKQSHHYPFLRCLI